MAHYLRFGDNKKKSKIFFFSVLLTVFILIFLNRKMNKILYLLIGLVILGLASYYVFVKSSNNKLLQTQSNLRITSTPAPNPNVDYHGAFAIFTNGTFRIFTASMYHNRSANVYIENPNPNIIYIKKRGTTWSDFFSTLPMKLTKECLTTGTGQTFCSAGNRELKFYLNGNLDQNALDRTINSKDQLLVTFGQETEAQIQKQTQQIPTVE